MDVVLALGEENMRLLLELPLVQRTRNGSFLQVSHDILLNTVIAAYLFMDLERYVVPLCRF